MQSAVISFEHSDETMKFPNGWQDVIELNGAPVKRASFQPGWRWSNDLRPLTGTESCPLLHTGYLLSGQLHVEMSDGSAFDIEQGDLCVIPPGHDAWVVGDDLCVLIDWAVQGGTENAEKVGEAR